MTAREVVDARKVKLGKRETVQILRGTQRILAVRGKVVKDWNLKRDPPVEKELFSAILGPTGNLRAPAVRLGKTLVVGFLDEAWDQLLS